MLDNTAVTITVTLSGSPGNYCVTVQPNKLELTADGVYDITWQAAGLAFVFDSTTPITFDGNHQPLTQPVYVQATNTATCTDTVTSTGSYPYTLHLVINGQPLQWPEQRHVGNGDPEIKNDPD